MSTAQLELKPYPASPGYKVPGTSQAAAESMIERAPTLRDKVEKLITAMPRTADECAALLNESVLAVRPRLSELKRMASIYDTGKRRPNLSGVQATVWGKL